jgi:hypothetical protein
MIAPEVLKRWVGYLTSESGNVESALVLIPLMILFLSVAQIGLSVYSRDIKSEVYQGSIAYSAMGIPQSSITPSASNSSQPLIALPLPGGGSILVGEQETSSPAITPLLPSGDSFGLSGIAVQE